MSGAFDWLDNLTTQVGNVAGKAVDAVGAVGAANAAANAAKLQNDQTAVKPAASLQATVSGNGSVLLWVGIGALVLVGGYLLLRKR